LILLTTLLVWSFSLITPSIADNTVALPFLNRVNLIFHEAGHVIFSPFGHFIHSLGGTLGQLLMPAICFWVLLVKTRDPFGGSVALWWLGESFLDTTRYINDARAGVLPLLGGGTGQTRPYGHHDWQYLLTETGLINLDHIIAKFVFFIGTLIMITALIWLGLLLFKLYKQCYN